MRILNFSHPLTQLQLDDISAYSCIPSADIQVEDISVQINNNKDLRPQLEYIVDQIHFNHDGEDMYINLPDLSIAAVLIVSILQYYGANVHLIRIVPYSTEDGLAFHFTEDGLVFQFKEIIDL